MDINYDDYNEKLIYYCHKCNSGIESPHLVKFCAICGHKFDPTKVNKIREKIKKLCYEEGS